MKVCEMNVINYPEDFDERKWNEIMIGDKYTNVFVHESSACLVVKNDAIRDADSNYLTATLHLPVGEGSTMDLIEDDGDYIKATDNKYLARSSVLVAIRLIEQDF